MSNKHNSNIISLMQTFDEIFDTSIQLAKNPNSKIVSTSNGSYSISNCITDSIGELTLGYYDFSPKFDRRRLDDYNYDFNWLWSIPTITYHIETPSYPVSNYSINEDGTSIIEIAVSGFNENEITVKREDLKIIVEGKKEKIEKEKRKYIYKHIAERDFSIDFVGSEKWNYDKLIVKLNNGILTITIPIKEEFKPINQTYKINK